jgi:ABC-type amino acid transport system permease subunit
MPPLTSQYLNLAKNSSLADCGIGYPDHVCRSAARSSTRRGKAIEIMAMWMG